MDNKCINCSNTIVNKKYYYIENNIIDDLYEECMNYFDDTCKELFYKLYLVNSVKDGYYCNNCIKNMIYSNDIDIDYINPWLAYEPLPDKQSICKHYKLDINKYNPNYIKPEDRLTRKNNYLCGNDFKYPNIKYILEPIGYYQNDEIIKNYNKMKLNPELFGNLSKDIIDNFKPLEYYLTNYNNSHNIEEMNNKINKFNNLFDVRFTTDEDYKNQ